jgi:2-polyprenyl-3-methyl-5-hydroxy-6-metoxy-1,4-benzoquinol methylase
MTTHHHDHGYEPEARTPAEYWEARYADGHTRWSGNVNASLATEVASLTPGTALDVGCGQGGDALWLAARGWTVTATDVAQSALDTGAERAAAAGVAAAITWEQHDLGVSFPAGTFDLVTTSFLHSPVELPRTAILRRAAAAVAPGGTLLVIGHAPSATHAHADLPTAEDVVADLALPADEWTVRTCALVELEHAFAGENPTRRTDAVVRYERRV